MCTVSIIPIADAGFRLAVNRDEKRDRAPALRPATVPLAAGGHAAWPTDAHAGGTWVAVSTRGLSLALLNGNPRPMPPLPPPARLASRGLILPCLIDADGARAAAARLADASLHAYAPFRLVAVDGERIVDAVWDRAALRFAERPLAPACFVSSGLGDHRAAPRVELFERTLAHDPTPAAQDAFHAHRWPERPEISVLMSRDDARTVSVTVVECAGPRPTLRYRDDAGEVALDVGPRPVARSAWVSHRAGAVPC